MTRAKRIASQDFSRLRHRAVVAFAARCARRVLPWFGSQYPNDGSVEAAVGVAERFGAGARVAAPLRAARAADASATDAAGGLSVAARAARFAAVAAGAAAEIVAAGAASDFAGSAARVAALAGDAAACTGHQDALGRAMQTDLLRLKSAAGQRWTDATPVPPEFFGPLWPDGPPDGLPRPPEESGSGGGRGPKAAPGARKKTPAAVSFGPSPMGRAERALYAAVFADPADDWPRMVYAHWLDEQGRSDHAEFIRAQLALAGIGPCRKPPLCRPPYCVACRTFGAPHVQYLRRVERELLTANRHRWAPNIPVAGRLDVVASEDWRYRGRLAVAFARGFPWRVTCRFGEWLRLGKYVVRSLPIGRVEPLDCRPAHDASLSELPWLLRRGAFGRAPEGVPEEIYPSLTGLPRGDAWHYPTEAAARDDLSAACLRREAPWDRRPAGQRSTPG
jgi:uncharacterized protein (TIGR02996 family)